MIVTFIYEKSYSVNRMPVEIGYFRGYRGSKALFYLITYVKNDLYFLWNFLRVQPL